MKNSHIFELIEQEKARQENTINLIASENYASPSIMKATGSPLTNKYAEGYPSARYYSGCEIIDKVECYARDKGRQLFEAEHINVQPHSGSQANMAAYLSMIKPGDTVLGMSLGSGGHLTHGHKINFSGIVFNFVPYHVSPETELLDYDEIELLAQQHKPKLIVAGASAYSRAIDFERFGQIARDANAFFMADMAHIAGLVATKLHQSPIPFADMVTSTTHKTLRGPRGGIIFSKQNLAQKLDRSVMPGSQGGPLMNTIAAKAVCFEEALMPSFKDYQAQVLKNAKKMAQTFQSLGYHIVSGGTDNHLFLVNLAKTQQESDILSTSKITGDIVEKTLEQCGITLNRNAIPFDKESPLITSGFRVGTPAVTTRGFKENDVEELTHWINEAIRSRNDNSALEAIRKKVLAKCKQFPIYSE